MVQLNSHNMELDDDDTIAIAVGGATAFVDVFQEMIDNYLNNFRDSNDGDDVSSVAQ